MESKKFLVGMLLATLASTAGAEPLEKLAGKLAKGLKDQESKKVAVLNFPYPDGGTSSGSSIVQERLTTFLAESGKTEVIERNLIKKVLEEMKLETTGIIDSATTKELGKILGVGALVTGTLNDLKKNKTEVNARIIQVETGKILAAGQTKIERTWTDSPVRPAGTKTNGATTTSSSGGSFLGKPLIQLAILLDTSNSMDGLIAQAKTQLWKIVNELASSERDGDSPTIQVSLYEYGNDNISRGENHLRQVLPFTTDLDKVSEKLFGLTTRGGQEYAGAVIQDAVQNLQWDKHDDVYKAVFIAGNEPFTQGPMDFREAIASAINKGILVNTIFCGNRQEGIATQWKAGSDLGNGDYMTIDQAVKVVYIQAPQDEEIQKLGNQINKTYIPRGTYGKEAHLRQGAQDISVAALGTPGAPTERALFKAKAQYSGAASSWDLVSEMESGKLKLEELKQEELPQDLKSLSPAELKSHIGKKIQERKDIQKRINELNKAREKYIAEEEKKKASGQGIETLDQAMLKAIQIQATKKNFKF
ncbi:MAG: VWA domain-containing protein, partial [Elusimicrobia bacterium]|nr:VWA domain-containing protein [Elusimicrobiota bacterium]